MFYEIHIVPTDSKEGLRFELSMFLHGSGDPVLGTQLETWDKVSAFLGSVNTAPERIDEARKKVLEKRKTDTIQNLLLTDEQLRRLGLKRK
jgi:hypothetical protein